MKVVTVSELRPSHRIVVCGRYIRNRQPRLPGRLLVRSPRDPKVWLVMHQNCATAAYHLDELEPA